MQEKVERTRLVSAEKALATARVRIEAEYRRRTPTSEVLREAAKRVLPGGDTRTITYFTPYPLFMAVGKGCRLTDVDGNVYLDCLNNYASLVHGHAHPRITEEVSHQIARGTAYAAPTESQTQLAQRICKRVKSVERVRFCNSGTEATMNAIRAEQNPAGTAGSLPGWRPVAQRAVRANLVILPPPSLNQHLCFPQGVEDLSIEKLVS